MATHAQVFFASKLQEGRRHVVVGGVGVAMASHFLNTTGPCYAVHVHLTLAVTAIAPLLDRDKECRKGSADPGNLARISHRFTSLFF